MVMFGPSNDPNVVLEQASYEKMKLTAFFWANANPALAATASTLMYQEFPQHFTYNHSTKKWSICKKGSAIGRMMYVPLNGGEHFYLHTLLTVAKGPKLFKDLQTINRTVYPMFHRACIASGLLQDDSEWTMCL